MLPLLGMRVPVAPYNFQILTWSVFLAFCLPNGYAVLICISLMINDIRCVFTCLFHIITYMHIFDETSVWIVCLLLVELFESLFVYILDASILLYKLFANIFIQSISYICYLSSIFQRAEVFSFDEANLSCIFFFRL